MKRESSVSKEEKEFYTKNCPLTINKKSFKKGYLNTLAKEKGTGRNILFHVCPKNIMDTDEIGKILILASAYKTDILVVFIYKYSMSISQVFSWLEKISKERINFLLVDMAGKN